MTARLLAASCLALSTMLLVTAAAPGDRASGALQLHVLGEAELFAPDVASTAYSEIRLTISPDGRAAMWFSRNRPGGMGGYDIWMSRRGEQGWSAPVTAPFNSPGRDFDPAFSPDGGFVYFCSDRPGGVGGDDVYRVAVTPHGFGPPENLGPAVNSAADEFAPMLSPDGTRLLFSSDRSAGAGRHDLYVAGRKSLGFETAAPLPGSINTAADEFDATFLSDGRSILFSRARDMQVDRVDLFFAAPVMGRYGGGSLLPLSVNDRERDTYGPMLDWSAPDRLTFSANRSDSRGMDLYLIRYRLERTSG